MCKETENQYKLPCKECPWVLNNRTSKNWRKTVGLMKTRGLEKHACHMQSRDPWVVTDENMCRGQNKN